MLIACLAWGVICRPKFAGVNTPTLSAHSAPAKLTKTCAKFQTQH